jgi:MaoC like domain
VEELARPPRLAWLYGAALAGLVWRPAGDTLPDTELVLRRVRADPARLAEYARVCGFRLTDTLPPTYPHVLAFPLALTLMTRPSFPFPAAGAVHVANRIELRRPVAVAEPLDLAVHAEGLRPHPRGRQLDLVVVATVEGEEVWRGESTYLHRSEGGSAPGPDEPAPAPVAVWRVGAEVGPAYAAVSGDRNPIHLSNLAARAFGFRRRVAHGMWTKARCLAQLGSRLPDAYAVTVGLRAPILLPASVGFSAQPTGTGWDFAVHDSGTGRPHLSGKVTRE